jgi:N-acetylglucosaminyldiphosphoundecaprenol N-acetyl-beta-D-mannosaminyltransferase
MQEKIRILKVRFNKITLKQATEKAISWTKSRKQRYITTPNPEILLEAHKNNKFRKILNKSALNIPDGIGILWAAKYAKITKNSNSKIIKFLKWIASLLAIPFYPKYLKTVLIERVTGIDLVQKICDSSANTDIKIFLLGAEEGIAKKTKKILTKKHPNLQIVGTYAGNPSLEDEKYIIEKINKANPEILFVAYGAPKQEMWISRNLKKLKSVKIAIGVGGTFNFISGKRKRAPRLMQNLGLEWLYRLIQQPSRVKRIFNAAIKFPIIILKRS